MTYQVLLFCTMVIYCGATSPDDTKAQIVKYENTNDGHGNYKLSFETTNGIVREESGHLVNVGLPDEHMEVEGLYSYIDTNGEKITVIYTADQNGYHVIQQSTDVPLDLGELLMSTPPDVVASLLG